MLTLRTESSDSTAAGLPARRRDGRGLTAVLRAVCGAPAGWREQRRGSFLVLVVGTLALMALITVVYVSVGSADRRTSAALAKLDKAEDVPDQVAAYISSIIADDVLDSFADSGKTRREAWDYPATDWSASSTQPKTDTDTSRNPALGRYFTPIGGHGDDPWLASTEPTWLGWGLDTPDLTSITPNELYLYQRDWAQISNISPDGRFINLLNLRNNFAAESGFGNDAKNKPRLSEDLHLVGLPPNPEDPPRYGEPPPTRTDFGLSLSSNKQYPAVWGQRQVGMFRQVFKGGLGPRPDSEFYPDNLFADADGDGFYDSRWSDLTDARDRDGDSKPDARPAIATEGRFRYVYGVRIVDLSGLVNVNTATDFRARPVEKAPVGLYPSDVDLRRLLTLRDFYDLYSPGGPSSAEPQTVGFNLLKQPLEDVPANYTFYTRDPAMLAGGPGYDALRLSIFAGLVPPATTTLDKFASAYKIGDKDWKFDSTTSGAEWRSAYYTGRGGRADGIAAGQVTGQAGYSVAGVFNTTDLLDLLTYRGVNNPALLSRLEQAVGGRDLATPGGANRRNSPLRDNRGLDLEREVIDPTDVNDDRQAMLRSAVDPRQRLTTISGARPIYSTLISSADQLAATEVRSDLVSLVKNKQVTQLTQTIANALMPDGIDPDAWGDPAGTEFRQRQTQFYGAKGPELALRISAHMAVNLLDSYDKTDPAVGGDATSAYTLLLDRNQKSRLSDTTLYPWWNDDKKIDLSKTGLGSTDILGGLSVRPVGIPAAVNIFGVEAQPFLTEIASFTVYTDSPNHTNEPEPPIGTDPDTGDPIYGPITIDGAVADANEDFLFRAVAFQIHNPFSESITLTPASMLGASADLSNSAPFNYIQFGGKTYLLAKLNDGAAGGAALEELRIDAGETIICYALSQSRTDINSRFRSQLSTPPPVPPDYVQEWIDGQLLGPGITRAVRIPWISATGAVQTSFNNLAAAGDAATGPITDATISIRRALRSTIDQGQPNNPANDLLVDRITLPDIRSIDRTRASGEQEVQGTLSGPADTEDNTGFTITLFGSVQRPTSGNKLGGFPSWCLQPRGKTDWNALEVNGAPNGISKGDFSADPTGTEGGTTFAIWVDKSKASAVCPSACTEPAQKTEHPVPPNADGVDYATLMPEITVNNNEFKSGSTNPVSTLRAADVMLTWGVGPWQDPSQPAATQWTTLGEAMALALNYIDTAAPPAAGTFESRLAGALDRGCLKLDAYVPFFDRDGDGLFTPDPITTPAPREERRGLGIPIAMNLLDALRGMPETAVSDEFGGLTRLTPGLININTAPLAVLRLLPLLAPTSDAAAWWWASAIDGETPLAQDADIAATVMAYRDKIPVLTRPDSGGAFEVVDFRDRGSGGYADPEIEDPTKLNGRSGRPVGATSPIGVGTGIDVIREDPGFRSLGEVLAARFVNPTDQTTFRDRNNIDHLAYDSVRNTVKGVTSTLHKDPVDGVLKATRVDDPYAEKLAVASGLLNTISVRSDVYAVWFVVRGYQQSDVEGLKQDDPMRPSIERRYVMVVDRSNVMRRGDKPRVLLFKEVPL
ncbi:MAG: hypothetical protein IT436_16945 [Phycisphaerales bacterium]|nr:hypothetical protein [Phycisphaerales bacterium]